MDFEFEHQEETPQETPSYSLHPVKGIVWASFWGSICAAGVVMAINYKRLGNGAAASLTLAISLLATIALFAFLLAIPDDIEIPNAVYLVPQMALVYLVANSLQGDALTRHSLLGGNVASVWQSVLIGLLCLPLVLGGLFGILVLTEPSFGPVVEFGDDEVYYRGDASEADARKLAALLQELGYFGTGGTSVSIESSSGQFTIAFVLGNQAWNDPEIVEAFQEIGQVLADEGFSRPLKIELCDEYFEPQKTLTIPELPPEEDQAGMPLALTFA